MGAPAGSRQELTARWNLNVAAQALGEYPGVLEPNERIDASVFAAEVEFPRFKNVAPELGIDSFDLCGGAVAEDFDGDGFVDLLSSTWDPRGQIRFYRNRGDGGFDERTREAGLEGLFGGLNLVSADYDNDGFVDVYVLRGGWMAGPKGKHPNSLLRNNGDGTFSDVTFAAGLGEVNHQTQARGLGGLRPGRGRGPVRRQRGRAGRRGRQPAVQEQRRRDLHRRGGRGRGCRTTCSPRR